MRPTLSVIEADVGSAAGHTQRTTAMRAQGWSGLAMLPSQELAYAGFRQTIENLANRFRERTGRIKERTSAA